MFIGHLPVGYFISTEINRKLSHLGSDRDIIVSGLVGSVLPDFDLLYYYLIDNCQHNHHSYLSHYPILWLSMLCLSVVFYRSNRGRMAVLLILISINGFCHMLLDSVCGDILWFAPISYQAYSLIEIPALYEPWWLNYLLHWTFLFELLSCCAFVFYYRKNIDLVSYQLRIKSGA
jgi:hypothetical protein